MSVAHVVTIDASNTVSACKDYLTAEWAEFKKSGVLKASSVCIYSRGGDRDYPCSVLHSVTKGVAEWELLLRDVVDAKYPTDKPVLDSEIVVKADGGISIFPERHKIDEKPNTTAYSVGPPPPPPAGRRRKPARKSAEEQFIILVEQVANYMLDHIKKISQPSVPIGNMKPQYLVIGSSSLVRCRLNYYKEVLRLPSSK